MTATDRAPCLRCRCPFAAARLLLLQSSYCRPGTQAVALFQAASTAPILRAGCASATATAPVSPSPCLYRQREWLAITSRVGFGLRASGLGGGASPTSPRRPYLSASSTAPATSRGFVFWPLQLRRSCALATPALLLLHRYRPRPAFIGSANGWPLRLGFP